MLFIKMSRLRGIHLSRLLQLYIRSLVENTQVPCLGSYLEYLYRFSLGEEEYKALSSFLEAANSPWCGKSNLNSDPEHTKQGPVHEIEVTCISGEPYCPQGCIFPPLKPLYKITIFFKNGRCQIRKQTQT